MLALGLRVRARGVLVGNTTVGVRERRAVVEARAEEETLGEGVMEWLGRTERVRDGDADSCRGEGEPVVLPGPVEVLGEWEVEGEGGEVGVGAAGVREGFGEAEAVPPAPPSPSPSAGEGVHARERVAHAEGVGVGCGVMVSTMPPPE